MDKRECRKNILDKRGLISPEEVVKYSYIVRKRLEALNEYRVADVILIYIAYKNEIDTKQIIENAMLSGKKVAVPKVVDDEMVFYYINGFDELEKGYKGILEPSEKGEIFENSENINVVNICPGAVFDKECNRIGYGGGFYDRYILKTGIMTIALAYDFQIVEKIDIEEHDMKMDIIVSDEKTMYQKRH